MTNQKIHYSKSKKVNDQMTNDEMPIKAINQCGSSLCRGFDDGKAFNAFVLLPNLVLPLPNLSLENAMSLEKTVSRKVKKKLRNGIGKQLYRDALQLRCG